jgi:hypothetical protein
MIWEYHLDDAFLGFAVVDYPLSLAIIYLLTLMPDSIAPSMYPWDMFAV